MAITANDTRFLFFAKSLGVSFANTLMLGRLELYVKKDEISKMIHQFGNAEKKVEEVDFPDKYSEPLFRILGAKTVDSMDFSNYEKATVLHDLNKPISSDLKNRFTAVIDGGTVEHVFNFPVAIRNCMEALKVGGHYIAITPANNTMGHGFYQFSPELFYNVFASANGFGIKKMVMYTVDAKDNVSDWYEVADPATAKSRVTLVNGKPTYIMLIAEKKAEVPLFETTPQQSDYRSIWAMSQALQENKAPENESRVRYLYRKLMPRAVRVFFYNLRNMFTKEKVKDENLGEIDATHFKKIKLPV
jgi:hypothetical protein